MMRRELVIVVCDRYNLEVPLCWLVGVGGANDPIHVISTVELGYAGLPMDFIFDSFILHPTMNNNFNQNSPLGKFG